MSFSFTLLSVALVIGVWYLQGWRKKKRLSATNWEQLVGKLREVPMIGITKVTLNYLQPREGQLAIQTEEMWFLVGGAEGLKRMQANAEILLQLAAFAQQWDLAEGVLVGDRMRRDGLMLRRAVGKMNKDLMFGCGRDTEPSPIQEAASAYYLMRQGILALYGTLHAGQHCRLSMALGSGVAACGAAL